MCLALTRCISAYVHRAKGVKVDCKKLLSDVVVQLRSKGVDGGGDDRPVMK